MRIGIDVAPLVTGDQTGIPVYVDSLVRTLLARARRGRGGAGTAPERFVLVGLGHGQETRALLEERALLRAGCRTAVSDQHFDLRLGVGIPCLVASDQNSVLKRMTQRIDGRLLIPLSDQVNRASATHLDVFHQTATPLQERRQRCAARRHIVTIYDLTTRLFPETHTASNRAYWEDIFRFARDEADGVIAISESARQDAITHLGLSPERVRAIPLAVRPTLPRAPAAPEAVRALRERLGLKNEQRYVLAVGSLEPRKNLPRLIEAFGALCRETNHKDVCLVLTGARQHGAATIEDAVARHDLAGRVFLTGYVADEELAALYQGCACFAYPSLYEGFGLPVLEAMALGAPVVTSNVSSLPEVAGDAALMVDPRNADEIAHALRRLLGDENLRDDLRQRGIERAALFSWERCAEEHVRVYREVAGA